MKHQWKRGISCYIVSKLYLAKISYLSWLTNEQSLEIPDNRYNAVTLIRIYNHRDRSNFKLINPNVSNSYGANYCEKSSPHCQDSVFVLATVPCERQYQQEEMHFWFLNSTKRLISATVALAV